MDCSTKAGEVFIDDPRVFMQFGVAENAENLVLFEFKCNGGSFAADIGPCDLFHDGRFSRSDRKIVEAEFEMFII